MTLTEWSEQLTTQLEALKSIPHTAENFQLIAISEMAKNGAQLEACSNLLELRGVAQNIKNAEKKLGRPIDGLNKEKNFLPEIVSVLDMLVAVVYYDHLTIYERLMSKNSAVSNTINNGMYVLFYGKIPGLIDQKPTVIAHAEALKQDIILILNHDERVVDLSRLHSKFIPLLSVTKESRFDVLLALVLNHPIPSSAVFCDDRTTDRPLSIAGKIFEEKIGKRLAQQFSAMTRIHSPEKIRTQLRQSLDETITVLENIRICKSIYEWNRAVSGVRPMDDIFKKFMRLCEKEDGAHQVFKEYECYLTDEKRKKSLPTVSNHPFSKEGNSSPATLDNSSPSSQTEENTGGFRGWLRWGVRTTLTRIQSLPGARFVPYLTPQKPHATLAPPTVDTSTRPEAPSSSPIDMQAMTKRILEKQIGKLNDQKEADSIEFTIADVEETSDKNLALMVKKAELLSIILKVNDSMSEYTRTHQSWFTQKFHGLFRSFREHDSEFIKQFFVPDKWKFIFEAEKLEEVTIRLKKKLETSSCTTIDEIDRELKDQLAISKRDVSKISHESVFFREKNMQDDLTKKIDEIQNNPRLG